MKTKSFESTDLKPIGYRTCPKTFDIDKSKPHAWFRFDADGYYEPAVLAQKLEITNLVNDIPMNTPLVIVIKTDNGKEVALVGYSCTFTFFDLECMHYKFKAHFEKQTLIISEQKIVQIYKPIGWLMDNREPEPVITSINI
jgi:hypothetical protein